MRKYASIFVFFIKICWEIQGLFWFHENIRTVYSVYVKNAIGILIWIALSL